MEIHVRTRPGREGDEETGPTVCLHCALAEKIVELASSSARYQMPHEESAVGRVINDVLNALGEFIASRAPCPERVAAGAGELLKRHTREAYEDYLQQGLRERGPHG